MSRQWVTDLKPFGTQPPKPYITDAPAILLVFRQTHSWKADNKKRLHYYSEISVAIAAGILLAAIQVSYYRCNSVTAFTYRRKTHGQFRY